MPEPGAAAAPLLAALRQAGAAYDSGDWQSAEQACARVLAAHPENVAALNLLGIICAQTRRGDSFASRVASSLLHAIGLPELVTSTTEEYVDTAVALAADGSRLAEIRGRLDANRLPTPLFDTERYTRDLERAYRAMYDRYQQGSDPADLIA